MTTEEIRKRLHANMEHFSFTKKDGTTREAFGTTNEDYVSEYGGTMGEGKIAQTDDVIRYFDVEKQAWRSFRTENFIEFISE